MKINPPKINITINDINAFLGGDTKKLFIIAAAAILFLFADIFFVMAPLIKTGGTLKAQIVEIKGNVKYVSQQLSVLDKTKQRLEALRANQAAYGSSFPKEDEVAALIGIFSTIAAKTGVEIIAVKPVKMDPRELASGPFHEIVMEINGKGGFHQFAQFVNKLENYEKFMNIKDIENIFDKASPRVHFFRIVVSIYILKS